MIFPLVVVTGGRDVMGDNLTTLLVLSDASESRDVLQRA